MKEPSITLTEFILKEEQINHRTSGDLTILLTYIENAGKQIASRIKNAGLAQILGHTDRTNASGERVQKLDEYSNALFKRMLLDSGQIAAYASEEEESIVHARKSGGKYIVYFDPLDGSSNIDVNVNVGTIFSIYRAGKTHLPTGSKQLIAGYILYGSSVMFVYTSGHGVHGFTLDPAVGNFILSHPNIRIPKQATTYSINEGYAQTFTEKTRSFLHTLKSNDMPYSLRYIGSMVADIHRTLLRGGIFLYPTTTKNPKGKLRLMFEINPLSYIITQAGGAAITTDGDDPLTIQPQSAHERASIVIGSLKEVQLYKKTL